MYEFLGYDRSQWSRWSNKNIVEDMFFEEGVDYIRFDIMSNGNKTYNYMISIDMAKELSMLSRNEKGKQARRYFIECENKLKLIDTHSYQIEDPIARAKKWIEERQQYELAVRDKNTAIEIKDRVIDAVKVLVAESINAYTISEVSKILDFNNFGEKKLFEYLRDNGILCRDKASYNEPTSVAINSGRFVLISKQYKDKSSGEVVVYSQSQITRKGVLWLYDRLIKQGYKSVVERSEVEDLFM